MLGDLGIDSLEFTTTVDLKMGMEWIIANGIVKYSSYLFYIALQLIGKPLGKPKYNCPFCDGCSPFEDPYNLYTLGDLFGYYQV